MKVNGRLVTELGRKVDPERDLIEIDSRPLPKEQEKIYLLLYKPSGTITTAKDPEGRKRVLDLIPKHLGRLFPVGRLDYETEGLLLLTNDGEMANKLIHPKYEIEKEYLVFVKGHLSTDAIDQLQKGVLLADGITSPAKVKVLERGEDESRITITIHEGRNRIVRRMCHAVGYPVIYLRRIRLGFLTLEGLQRGGYRRLTTEEVKRLQMK